MTYAGPREGWSAVSTAEAEDPLPFPRGLLGAQHCASVRGTVA